MAGSSDVPALSRALAVLRLLASRPGPLAAAAIARELRIPRSTAYHLLAVLTDEGFVTHLPEERRYALGVTSFEIGSAYLRQEPLARLGRPLLAQVSERLAVTPIGGRTISCTLHLGVLHGREVLYVVEQRPERPEGLVTDVGVRLPAHLTASGRAMLGALPAVQIRALFPDPASFVDRTGRGPKNLPALRRTLAAERRDGYALERDEVTDGYSSVAVAAHDHAGRPAAAVAVTYRSDRIDDAGREVLVDAVRRTAGQLTRRLRGAP